MVNVCVVYDPSSGKIERTFSYRDELMDFDLSANLKAGESYILTDYEPDPFTEYYPGGVRTTRPLFTDIASWDKICVEPNGTEAATFGPGLPNPTYLSVSPDQYIGVETIEGTCTDGAASITFNRTGLYNVRAMAWPYQDFEEQIGANIYPPRTKKYVFSGYDAVIPDIAGRTRYELTGYVGYTSDHTVSKGIYNYNILSYTPTFTNRVSVAKVDYNFIGWVGNASKQQVIPTSGLYTKTPTTASINNSIHLAEVYEFSIEPKEATAKAGLFIADFAEYSTTSYEAYTPSKITNTTVGNYVLTGYVEETTVEGDVGSYVFTGMSSEEEE